MGAKTGRKSDRLPVAPLRAAFEASGLTATAVAHRLGWKARNRANGGMADSTRVKRALGFLASTTRGKPSVASTIHPDRAKLICEAIGCAFDEVYPVLPAEPVCGGYCACGEKLARPAPRCGFCVAEERDGVRLPA